jgi:hypothetical protein
MIGHMLQKKQHGAKVVLRPAAVKGEYNEICLPQPLSAGSRAMRGAC